MRHIILRKDKTSISCAQSSVPRYISGRKMRLAELTIAILLILLGASIMLSVQ